MDKTVRIAEIKTRLKQGKYYVPYAPEDIEYLLSELDQTRLERNKLEANKNYYKAELAKYKDTRLTSEQVLELKNYIRNGIELGYIDGREGDYKKYI